MYVPRHFLEIDPAALHDAIARFPLATLVSASADGLVASHVPMLYDAEPAPHGTLVCHVARANPHWRLADQTAQALAIFCGPGAYVSPSWYETKRETGKVVPTWNYVAVHAYGSLRAFDDPVRLRALVARLTDTHESRFAAPWSIDDAPEGYIDSMLSAIVGLEMPVTRLIGKWKLSQNRRGGERREVEEALLAGPDVEDRRTGEEMRRRRAP